MLARVRGQRPVIAADARRLPLRRAAADIVVAAFVLHHIRAKALVLEEARGALRRGGLLGVAAWGRGPMDCPAFLAWSDLLDAHGAPPDPSPHRAWHRTLEAPGRLARLLREARFHPVRAWNETREHLVAPGLFAAYALGIGVLRDRLEAMPGPARAAFLLASRRLVGSLDRSAFLWRGDVAFAVARRP
jgi:SAM-dependent methyltransferase